MPDNADPQQLKRRYDTRQSSRSPVPARQYAAAPRGIAHAPAALSPRSCRNECARVGGCRTRLSRCRRRRCGIRGWCLSLRRRSWSGGERFRACSSQLVCSRVTVSVASMSKCSAAGVELTRRTRSASTSRCRGSRPRPDDEVLRRTGGWRSITGRSTPCRGPQGSNPRDRWRSARPSRGNARRLPFGRTPVARVCDGGQPRALEPLNEDGRLILCMVFDSRRDRRYRPNATDNATPVRCNATYDKGLIESPCI